MDQTAERRTVLGARALWGWVGYAGEAFAPAEGTYPGIDAVALAYTTTADSGEHPRSGAKLANLYPLIAAALYEAGFARELGPLTSWSN
jgi:hypothetical protein